MADSSPPQKICCCFKPCKFGFSQVLRYAQESTQNSGEDLQRFEFLFYVFPVDGAKTKTPKKIVNWETVKFMETNVDNLQRFTSLATKRTTRDQCWRSTGRLPHYRSTNKLKPNWRISIKLGTIKRKQGHTLRPVSKIYGVASAVMTVYIQNEEPQQKMKWKRKAQTNDTNTEDLQRIMSRFEGIIGVK